VSIDPILAVIPARGGSKGLPGKNTRPLAGLPLIAHSIRYAAMCPEIARTIVTTDCNQIAEVARAHGGEVPFLRPPALARDDTGMLEVLQHAISQVESEEGRRYRSVLLLQPTDPCRLPSDVTAAVSRLDGNDDADGLVTVSRPSFNPVWQCVTDDQGFMAPLHPEATTYVCRQQLPQVFRINGMLFLWRRDFLMNAAGTWRQGRHLLLEVPERRAIDIDDLETFELAELLIREGMIKLPWLGPENEAKKVS
jgi:N-acylneuraminate cytidylyltransferase